GRGRNAPVARLTRPDLALLAIGPDEAQYGLVRQIGAAVVIEGDAGAHHRAVDARVLDHARALPASDQPGERVDLGGEALGEEEGHRLGAFTTRHTTMPTTHGTAWKDRPASAKKVASRAVIVRPVYVARRRGAGPAFGLRPRRDGAWGARRAARHRGGWRRRSVDEGLGAVGERLLEEGRRAGDAHSG